MIERISLRGFGAPHPRQFAAFTRPGETLQGAPAWNQLDLPQVGLAAKFGGTRLARIVPVDGRFNAVPPIPQGRRDTRPHHSNAA